MGTVQVPLWLLLLLSLLAAAFLLERLLLPGVRVVLRRRMRALAEELSQRWAVRLQPFKLAKKRAVEQALTHDPEVLRCAEAYRRERQLSWREVEDLLASYAREIVPTFNVYLYYRLGHALARRVLRAAYLVRVGFADKRALSAVDPEASVVFLMNHRSNADYLLVAYLVSRHAAISYAVGEWAKVWPLDTFIRRLGGYFVRRNTADPLYRKVLERYVQMAAEAGIAQGVFPEGRLTRDGSLQPPKLGLLHYLLKRFDPQGERDLVFVPVGINYDRVLEDRTHAFAESSGPSRFSWAGVRQAGAWALRMGLRALAGRAQRFGYAAVHFGVPVGAKQLLAEVGELRGCDGETYRAKVAQVGERLWERVAAAVPAVPFPILCQALLACGGRGEKSRVQKLFAQLAGFYRSRGLLLPELEPGALYRHAVQLGLTRKLLREEGETLAVVAEQEPLLRFYANSLAHHRAL
jgi:glycerol-3-phosphate O-acyltransferase